jgi:peptidoglycan/xylan/chitin deacetylase (PgdA/CDA1 family)
MLRTFLVFLLIAVLLLPATASAAERRAAVLCYHEVDPVSRARFSISERNFIEQLDYLERAGFTVIPLSMLVEYLAGERETLPPNPVVITVDDGYECTYSVIYPEMRRRGLPFTVFIYPRFVGGGRRAITWPQIREMARNGVDIESHTMSHPFLPRRWHQRMSSAEYEVLLDRELRGSRKLLERETGRRVQFLAYPYGAYDSKLAARLASYGYKAALTTEDGSIERDDDLFKLDRYCVERSTSVPMLAMWLSGTHTSEPAMKLAAAGVRVRTGTEAREAPPQIAAVDPRHAVLTVAFATPIGTAPASPARALIADAAVLTLPYDSNRIRAAAGGKRHRPPAGRR